MQSIYQIKDPDLGVSLAELNAVTTCENNNLTTKSLKIKLTLPGPTTYLHKEYSRIFNAIGGELCNASLSIIESSEYLKKRPGKLSNIKHIIAIASGKGGVGKSTIACNFACELALQGAKVGILDGDIYGPSQPIMFGLSEVPMEAETDQHGKTLAYPVEKYRVKVASMGFVLNRNASAVLRGPILGQVFNMFVEQIEWGELDYLIVDLPPGTGDIHLNFVNQLLPDGVVLITTPQEISLSDVRRSADLFKKMNVPIIGILENMSYFIPPDMPDKKYYIFGGGAENSTTFGEGGAKKLAVELDLSVLGEIPLSVRTQAGSDSGVPIVLVEGNDFQKEIIKNATSIIVSELRRQAVACNP